MKWQKKSKKVKSQNINLLIAFSALVFSLFAVIYLIVLDYKFNQFVQPKTIRQRPNDITSSLESLGTAINELQGNFYKIESEVKNIENKVMDELIGLFAEPFLSEVTVQPKMVYTKDVQTALPNEEKEGKNLIYTMDFNGQKNLIYSYDSKLIEGGYPWARLTRDNKIYIARLGEKGFTLLDMFGNDITAQDKYIAQKDEGIAIEDILLTSDEKKIVYTTEAEKEKKVYIKDLEKQTVEAISDESFPKGLAAIKPIGWSSEKNVFYLRSYGWEGPVYSHLWRVNIKTKKVDKIIDGEKENINKLFVNSLKDLAVGITAEIDKSKGLGIFVPPASMKIINLKTGLSFILTQSQDTVFEDVKISDDGRILIFKEGPKIKMANLQSQEIKTILENIDQDIIPLFLSPDQKTLIYSKLLDTKIEDGLVQCAKNCQYQYFMRNIELGTERIVATDEPSKVRYSFLGVIK